jgi:hypothetical protein
MAYGFCITARGWQLLGNLIASAQQKNETPQVRFSRVGFGSGKIPEGTNPADMTDLLEFVANGSSTEPIVEVVRKADGDVEKTVISFVVEYRSDMNEDVTESFWINEFSVFAIDTVSGEEVSLYRGDLGDYPQPVTPFAQGAIDVRRFPVSIVVTGELKVELLYPPLAFITAEDMHKYAISVCKPMFLDLARAYVDNEHNFSDKAHPDIRTHAISNETRIAELERLLTGNGGKAFFFDFYTLNGLNLEKGVWNTIEQRIEF